MSLELTLHVDLEEALESQYGSSRFSAQPKTNLRHKNTIKVETVKEKR